MCRKVYFGPDCDLFQRQGKADGGVHGPYFDRGEGHYLLYEDRFGGGGDDTVAAPPGFEPGLKDPKSLVLPLHHGAVWNRTQRSRFISKTKGFWASGQAMEQVSLSSDHGNSPPKRRTRTYGKHTARAEKHTPPGLWASTTHESPTLWPALQVPLWESTVIFTE